MNIVSLLLLVWMRWRLLITLDFSTRNKFFKVIITTSLLFAGGILTIGMLNVRRVVGHFYGHLLKLIYGFCVGCFLLITHVSVYIVHSVGLLLLILLNWWNSCGTMYLSPG